ncbi:hypothetical protein ACET3X_002049 [Alternaria dauci]|uniref:Uncharacterized protein n=1 Tax=Alternaria dauci TaxID=48095 RepID=A0ABR3UZD8_9PLEO
MASPPPQMTFQLFATRLPMELFLMTLKEWIDNPNPVSAIPGPLYTHYIRERVLAWLTDTKDFTDPPTFYLSHLLTSLKLPDHHLPPYDLSSHPLHALSQDPNLTLTTTPLINNTHTLLLPHLAPTTHGFEKIKLDFTAAQYFALFDIRVPPFHYADTSLHGDNLYHDAATHSAGLFLAHTRVLELHFGTAYKSANPCEIKAEGV